MSLTHIQAFVTVFVIISGWLPSLFFFVFAFLWVEESVWYQKVLSALAGNTYPV